MSRYLIEVSREQLEGLKHAVILAEREHSEAIREREEAVKFWEQQSTEHEAEKSRYLAMAKENLEYARNHLALVLLAAPALYAAEFMPAPKGDRS